MPETLYIIDGHSQIYRAYYAPFGDLTAPSGEPTRATHVFCSALLKFIRDNRPTHLAMTIDGPIAQLHRRKLYAEYKVTRKPMPEDMLPQVTRIIQIVGAMGIPVLHVDGYEADDVIATAVEKLAGGDAKIVIISRDKDLDQLLGPSVELYDPMKGETVTAESLLADKGYPPAKAVEVQALSGDTSDNIPGVPGIGPKKAADLIARYGSADAVLAHAGELTPKMKENVLANADKIALSRALVTLDRHVPIDLSMESLRFGGVFVPGVRDIFAELGLNRMLEELESLPEELTTAVAPPQPSVTALPGKPEGAAAAPEPEPTTAESGEYRCVDAPARLDALLADLAGVERLSVDTETTALRPMWCELVGISLAWGGRQAAYIPVRGPLGATVLDVALVRDKLGPLLADEKVVKIGQNIKYDLIVLARAGMELRGRCFDTMIAAHVLDSTRASYKLDNLAMDMLNHRCIPIEDVIGSGRNETTMDTVPIDTVVPYACEDAEVALRLADVLGRQLAAEGLEELFEGLEMPLMPVLASMEMAGVKVDPEVLKKLEGELSRQADELRERIVSAAGRQFNVDSPKQLAEVLFDELKLPVVKKTKTGPSTDSSVLEELAADGCAFADMVLEYRKLTKLLGTYLTGLAQSINPKTGRVHTSFRQTSTVTGRLSSTDPNLQNIPVRTAQGRLIRSAFVAGEGCVLLSADYSQVELRVLAHLCQDPRLMAAFESDQDIHRTVAAEVFEVPPEQVTADQRAKAKTVNFGIVYGQTAFGLSRTLRIGRSDAQDFISRYHKRFPRIHEFLRACVAKAKADGYVETVSGRRRRITELDSPNAARRAGAERLAINSVVQGSAADLIKRAMVNIDDRIRREGRPSRMLIQIHDELVFDIPADSVADEQRMIVEEMTGAFTLRVPLKVDTGTGANWMEAK